jgi:hypothetical protein
MQGLDHRLQVGGRQSHPHTKIGSQKHSCIHNGESTCRWSPGAHTIQVRRGTLRAAWIVPSATGPYRFKNAWNWPGDSSEAPLGACTRAFSPLSPLARWTCLTAAAQNRDAVRLEALEAVAAAHRRSDRAGGTRRGFGSWRSVDLIAGRVLHRTGSVLYCSAAGLITLWHARAGKRPANISPDCNSRHRWPV